MTMRIPPEARVWHMDDSVLRYQKTKDAAILSSILQAFEPLVDSICHKFFLPWGDNDDLMQEGRVGLFKAILRFSPDKNMKFAQYAIYSIRRNVISALRGYQRIKHTILTDACSFQEAISNQDPIWTWESLIRSNLPNPDELVEMQEDARTCHKLLCQRLSELELKCFLGWVQGDGYGEIAKRLGNSMKSVDNALQRAKNQILKLDMKDPAFYPSFRNYLSCLCSGIPYGTQREADILHSIFENKRKPPRKTYTWQSH